ncbi:hypothetical protein DFP74_0185 [Nocardiopsis sp. Huas11]|uniref:hypothetical protein n=1 Tax=Nocardiopsis sp. Huas11 TaxID=2183912 RepID=UPI000EB5275C|nr:hypothetical protein [Nocardiopsis sp. Huas11]RKS04625.1 hypothetical protein DFP74_0185 [Nocardiopsis sp. Huas11]
MRARFVIPVLAAIVALVAFLFPGPEARIGPGTAVLVFVVITLLGFAAVWLRRFPRRGFIPPAPPRPTDDRVPFVLHDPAAPIDRTPSIPGPTPVSDRAVPLAVPPTPEHARVLGLLASAPDRRASTPAAADLTGLPTERLVPLLADLTHARLVERDAVADLWRVTGAGE